jgi:ferredoxin
LFGLSGLFLLMPVMPSMGLEEARFPRPEFTGTHQTPNAEKPMKSALLDPHLTLGLLFLALGLTGFALHHLRSRHWLRIIGLGSLCWFGFFYQGCVCPVGSIQNIARGLADSSYPVSLHVIGTFFLPLLAALFFGRLFCGAVCPFGVLQDLVNWKTVRIPLLLDRCLRTLPFIVLGLAVYSAVCDLGFIVCRFDPFVPVFRLSGPLPMVIGSALLLTLGVFIARPYCRYICPYSVLLAAASILAYKRVQVFPDRCVNCSLCLESCPVGAIVPGIDRDAPGAFPESRSQALSRLHWLVALSPAILAMGMFTGANLGEPLSRLHREIVLDERVQAGMLKENDVIAFFNNDGHREGLHLRAQSARRTLKRAGGVFGIYLGFIFIGSIVAITRRRQNRFHQVDPWNCIACGRCYDWCPRNREVKR